MYYIYRNAHRKRARTHLAECQLCDHGRWQPTDTSEPGIWLGPYDRSQAFEVVGQLACETCPPNLKCPFTGVDRTSP